MAPGLLTILPAAVCLVVSVVMEDIFAFHLASKRDEAERIEGARE
jgi:hypothetical protein